MCFICKHFSFANTYAQNIVTVASLSLLYVTFSLKNHRLAFLWLLYYSLQTAKYPAKLFRNLLCEKVDLQFDNRGILALHSIKVESIVDFLLLFCHYIIYELIYIGFLLAMYIFYKFYIYEMYLS